MDMGKADESTVRDVSWLDASFNPRFSDDGKSIAFTEQSEAFGNLYAASIRPIDGGEPVHLGDGYAIALSPDSQWLLVMDPETEALTELPTGPGQARPLALPPNFHAGASCSWLPDGSGIVALGTEGIRRRGFVVPRQGAPRPIDATDCNSAEHVPLTPDRRYVAYPATEGVRLSPLNGSPPIVFKGSKPGDRPLRLAGPETLFVLSGDGRSMAIERIDGSSGARSMVRSLALTDPRDLQIWLVDLSSDGRQFAETVESEISSLFLAAGIR